MGGPWMFSKRTASRWMERIQAPTENETPAAALLPRPQPPPPPLPSGQGRPQRKQRAGLPLPFGMLEEVLLGLWDPNPPGGGAHGHTVLVAAH